MLYFGYYLLLSERFGYYLSKKLTKISAVRTFSVSVKFDIFLPFAARLYLVIQSPGRLEKDINNNFFKGFASKGSA